MPNSEIELKIKEKTEYVLITPSDFIPEEHDLSKWVNFLPPLKKFHINHLENVSDGFTEKLQDELVSTENQILTARTRFNEAVKPYNTHIKTFPNSIFAGMFGFKEKPYFEAAVGADKPVEVKF